MTIISISGLDGSGKSTQIEFLKKHLESQGKRVFYFHAITFSFAKKLQNLNKIKSNSKEESVTSASWIQIQLRKLFLLIDILRFRQLVNSLSKKGFDYILSDRFFYDSVINIKYLSGNNMNIFAEKLIPSPNMKIYLDAEPAIIMQRKRVPDQGFDYLKIKRGLFENCIEKYDLTKIDGNRSPDEIHKEIKSLFKI